MYINKQKKNLLTRSSTLFYVVRAFERSSTLIVHLLHYCIKVTLGKKMRSVMKKLNTIFIYFLVTFSGGIRVVIVEQYTFSFINK